MRGEDDFQAFYRTTYARLVGQVRTLTGDLETAEDAVQEAFVRAAGRWRQVRAYQAPELWVRKTAFRLAVDALRRARCVDCTKPVIVRQPEAAERRLGARTHPRRARRGASRPATARSGRRRAGRAAAVRRPGRHGDRGRLITAYLRVLMVGDASPLTCRSYAQDLLRWFRLLWAVETDWRAATEAEVALLVSWMRHAPNPQRRRRRTGTPPPAWLAGGRAILEGSHVHHRPVDEGGAQLFPGSLATSTPQAFLVASTTSGITPS